jgi:GR25 family glycosyltransferase involved in LPS biosynthesis
MLFNSESPILPCWSLNSDISSVVSQNLSTAVIFEDDVDWDIRLRDQLEHFAKASRILTAGPQDFSTFPVVSSDNPEDAESIHSEVSDNEIAKTLFSLPLSYVPSPTKPAPYGDPSTWDVLWLGHCGAGFPRPSGYPDVYDENNLLLMLPDDDTVPQPQYLRAHPFGPLDALAESHPPHTRVYHRASGGALCTVAYAVSQRGARRLLQEYSVTKWSKIWDAELGEWCAGTDSFWKKLGERKCITSQPPIFAHHHPPGGRSNIGGLGGGYATNVESKYLRLSVRMNLQALVRGEGVDGMEDQWPDVD